MLLFWLAGLLYEIGATRCVLLLAPTPVLLAMWVFMLMINGGFPCSLACFGEIFLLCGLIRVSACLVVCSVINAGIVTLTGLFFWVHITSGRPIRVGPSHSDASFSDVVGIVMLGCVVVWGFCVVDIVVSSMVVLVV